jgi:hypothetical protein
MWRDLKVRGSALGREVAIVEDESTMRMQDGFNGDTYMQFNIHGHKNFLYGFARQTLFIL